MPLFLSDKDMVASNSEIFKVLNALIEQKLPTPHNHIVAQQPTTHAKS